MVETVIKNFTIIICSIYSYRKLLHFERVSKVNGILTFTFSLASAFSVYAIRLHDPLLSLLIMITLIFIFTTLITRTALELSITTTILSLGISYTASAFAILIVGIIIYILSTILVFDPEIVPFLINVIAIAAGQYILTLLPFRLKRLRKGMPFLRKIGSTNAGVLISIALLCSVILISTRQFTPSIFILLYLSIHLFSVFVFLWWRSRIKQSYLEGVRKLEKEELQNTVYEKECEIEKLKRENEALSKIIHRDNKLIPAMAMVVSDFLQCFQDKDKTELREKGEELLSFLQSSAKDRLGMLHEYQMESKILKILFLKLI